MVAAIMVVPLSVQNALGITLFAVESFPSMSGYLTAHWYYRLTLPCLKPTRCAVLTGYQPEVSDL
ncbi:Uncharacterised protein [Yersinia aldovae]|nr:Uncharacterised protein [Yersinia aldovae]